MHQVNKCFRLVKRPLEKLEMSDLTLQKEKIAPLRNGEVLVQTQFVSVDPTNRIWMSERDQYMEPIQLGDIVRAGGVGVVVSSNAETMPVGQLVTGLLGWQTLGAHNAAHLQVLPNLPVPPTAWLSSLGMTSATAYFGLTKIGHVKSNDTVVVSGAAGAVGSVAGQIAKNLGCQRVVGIVGSNAKASWLKEELGFDSAVNYNDENFVSALKEACPNGIDVYFENVGGAVLETVLPLLNNFARIPLCGLISSYNHNAPFSGPKGFEMLLMRRVHLQGFIVSDYFNEFPQATKQLLNWWQHGKLKTKETLVTGFENLPNALNMLFEGKNTGKLIVCV